MYFQQLQRYIKWKKKKWRKKYKKYNGALAHSLYPYIAHVYIHTQAGEMHNTIVVKVVKVRTNGRAIHVKLCEKAKT